MLGALIGIGVLLKRWLDRLGIPVALLFLTLGMLAGSEGIGGLAFDDYGLAFRLGTLSLVFILFDGGFNTHRSSIRSAAGPAGVLATAGVLITAGLTAGAALLLGFEWQTALLLGAIVSSTDAATVFAVLRGSGLKLKGRLGSTLELESGANDPMAVILTFTLAGIMVSPAGSNSLWWAIAVDVPLQLIIGLAAGAAVGKVTAALLYHVRLTTSGLYPIITLASALVAFGGATLLHGSGILAVYVAGIVLGNSPLPARAAVARVHDAMAWLSQISMFVMLGLLVFPSRLGPAALDGTLLALTLAFVARPLAVALCLIPFKFPPREIAYLGWVGLRGAVPVILATYPVIVGVKGAEQLFDIVFFLVVFNAVLPGASVKWLTQRWNLGETERPVPPAALEIHSSRPMDGELVSFYIDPTLAVCNATLADIPFPKGANAAMLVRGGTLVACRGDTVLLEGDHVYIFFQHADRGYIELLFGGDMAGSSPT